MPGAWPIHSRSKGEDTDCGTHPAIETLSKAFDWVQGTRAAGCGWPFRNWAELFGKTAHKERMDHNLSKDSGCGLRRVPIYKHYGK